MPIKGRFFFQFEISIQAAKFSNFFEMSINPFKKKKQVNKINKNKKQKQKKRWFSFEKSCLGFMAYQPLKEFKG